MSIVIPVRPRPLPRTLTDTIERLVATATWYGMEVGQLNASHGRDPAKMRKIAELQESVERLQEHALRQAGEQD